MQPDDFPKNDESSPLGLRVGTGATGLEPATSGVTGRRSNQLSYAPVSRAKDSARSAAATGCSPGRLRGGAMSGV